MEDIKGKESSIEKKEPLIMESDVVTESFHIVICDDELELLNNTEKIVSKVAKTIMGNIRVEPFSSPVLLLDELKKRNDEGDLFPDLIIMDIQMPEMGGIEFGKKLREFAPDVTLIYLTSFTEYALKGYEAKAFRYILKPISEEVMAEVFTDILKERSEKKKLLVSFSGGESIVPLSEIIYLVTEDKYTIVYTKNEHYCDVNSLNLYEKILAPYGFYRIHRSYLVNMAYHRSLGKSHIILEGGIELPISRRRKMSYKKAVIQEMRKDILL